MYRYLKPIGYQAYGNSLGQMWISLVKLILERGNKGSDESRKRLALQNVRVKSISQNFPDAIITQYGNKKNLNAMINLTFKEDKMYDVDVTPNFSPGPKSYSQRLKKGKMVEYIVKRLGKIPESKKAVIVFPTYEDYKAILKKPKDDYLPCIISLQFRLRWVKKRVFLDTTFYARSIDVFQKAHGNFVAIAMLTNKIALMLGERLHQTIQNGFLDGIIADAHIYTETIKDAKALIAAIKNS